MKHKRNTYQKPERKKSVRIVIGILAVLLAILLTVLLLPWPQIIAEIFPADSSSTESYDPYLYVSKPEQSLGLLLVQEGFLCME